MTPKIYVFVNGRWGNDCIGLALAEDGHCLGSHLSSSEMWSRHDMGLTSDWKHDGYKEHYPDGYELEWVDDPKKHEGLMAAYKKNQELKEEDKEEKEETEAAHPAHDLTHYGSDG